MIMFNGQFLKIENFMNQVKEKSTFKMDYTFFIYIDL